MGYGFVGYGRVVDTNKRQPARGRHRALQRPVTLLDCTAYIVLWTAMSSNFDEQTNDETHHSVQEPVCGNVKVEFASHDAPAGDGDSASRVQRIGVHFRQAGKVMLA